VWAIGPASEALSLDGASGRLGIARYEPSDDSWVRGPLGPEANTELIGGLIGLAWYVTRVVQPKAVAAGYEPIRRSQRMWFVLAAIGLWAASDWPVPTIIFSG